MKKIMIAVAFLIGVGIQAQAQTGKSSTTTPSKSQMDSSSHKMTPQSADARERMDNRQRQSGANTTKGKQPVKGMTKTDPNATGTNRTDAPVNGNDEGVDNRAAPRNATDSSLNKIPGNSNGTNGMNENNGSVKPN